MKKKMIFAALLLVVATALGAQTKQVLRSAKTEAAAAARTLKKEGFKMVELGDLQSRLEQFFVKISSGCVQVVGMSENCISSNLAKMTAINNAANEYASNAGGMVRGRIVSDAGTITGEQVDAIVAAYERIVLKEIKGELVPFVSVIKKNGKKGGYDGRAYCLVDLDYAHEARMKAMERALEETKYMEKYGSMISDWIDEGIEKIK